MKHFADANEFAIEALNARLKGNSTIENNLWENYKTMQDKAYNIGEESKDYNEKSLKLMKIYDNAVNWIENKSFNFEQKEE